MPLKLKNDDKNSIFPKSDLNPFNPLCKFDKTYQNYNYIRTNFGAADIEQEYKDQSNMMFINGNKDLMNPFSMKTSSSLDITILNNNEGYGEAL